MGLWSLYFLAKLGLYWTQRIELAWGLNLLFALCLAWPLEAGRWRLLRNVLALPLAVALLYRESHLPPFARLWSQRGALADFSPDYLAELAGRFVAWPLVGALLALGVAFVLLRRHLRFATLALLGLISVPLLPAPGFWARPAGPVADRAAAADADAATLAPGQLQARLNAFYATESERVVALPPGVPPAFDIVVLSVCSLSWDDLDAVGARQAPLLQQFDIVFRQFNSAASYSGPAALRLLRASCGQTPQRALYEPAPAGCYLFDNLARAGYSPALLMNHDGRFDNFAQLLNAHGGPALETRADSGARVAMQGFDGSPVYADDDTLVRWWRAHAAAPGRLALLYNTISLHDGNRVPGLSSLRSTETFKPRLLKLFADLERFIAAVQASGRPTLLLLVPEHGGAVRGDAVQIPGLRELPSPAITNVPAAVRLIGFEGLAPGGVPIVVDKPSSYLALAALVAQLMPGGRVVGGRESLEALVRELPGTNWVAENEETVLLRQGENAYLSSAPAGWTPYRP